jgi:hypothetical protein
MATAAPIALLFRRGPSDWWHLMRWHFADKRIEHGAWVRKKIFPRRCDLSSDGTLMTYFLSGGFEGRYRVYAGVSRAPWLAPLESWEEIGTWGRGYGFSHPHPNSSSADRGSAASLRSRLHQHDVTAFAVERLRGWTEAAGSPRRSESDVWDVRRNPIFERAAPSGAVLRATRFMAFQSEFSTDGQAIRYDLRLPTGECRNLHDVVWADWDCFGRLITATTRGGLFAERVVDGRLVLDECYSILKLQPEPREAPEWARAPW